MTTFLVFDRWANLLFSSVALAFSVFEWLRAVPRYGRRRVMRYLGYAGFAFLSFEGSLESALQGAPVGVKTVLTTVVLVFAIYSLWPAPLRPWMRAGHE